MPVELAPEAHSATAAHALAVHTRLHVAAQAALLHGEKDPCQVAGLGFRPFSTLRPTTWAASAILPESVGL